MSLYLEQKYILSLSNRFRNFKRKDTNLFVFSCPICGDSDKNQNKARGNFFLNKGHMQYHCYNCGVSMGFDYFLKKIDYNQYIEYIKEKLTDEKPSQLDYVDTIRKPTYIKDTPLNSLKKISQLDHNHVAKKYVIDRRIPNEFHSKMFYCDAFYNWINDEVVKNKFDDELLKYDEPRLIIPLIDKNDDMHGLQGRSFKKNSQTKYITIITNDHIPAVWGLNRVNFNQPIPVFEGPIKAMFIDNAISSCGGQIEHAIATLPKNNMIICYDNEPRKKETINKMKSAIQIGYRVCFWPKIFKMKDVDDLIVKGGFSSKFILDNIIKHSYIDMKAMLELQKWSEL